MNRYVEHFERELKVMRPHVPDNDELIIEPYIEAIKPLLEVFSEQSDPMGTAHMTAGVIARTVKAVLGLNILSPLTGEDWEWEKKGDVYQNIRDGGVFRDADGKCSYNTCIVWKGEQPWDTFVGDLDGIGSKHYIKSFPFMPKTFYVDVYRQAYDQTNPEHKGKDVVKHDDQEMIYFIKDKKQLTQVFNYYEKQESL